MRAESSRRSWAEGSGWDLLQVAPDIRPWTQRLSEVWRMRDPEERQASLALRSGHGNRLRHAIGWYRTHDRLHTGDPVAMASGALAGYLTDREAGKESLLICDTWEMADALNRRLHDTLTTAGPTAQAVREQAVRVGDLIISRHNHATITVGPGNWHQRGKAVEQVRNGNRWRVTAVSAETNRVAAERLTDNARVIGGGATRAMAYVAMSRGRDTNQAYIYTRDSAEADHDHRQPVVSGELHELRRGTKYSAAHYLRSIIANDDQPRTMHVEAQRTGRALLPNTIGRLLDRHDQRLIARAEAWREHAAAARGFRAASERMMSAADRTADRSREIDVVGLEL